MGDGIKSFAPRGLLALLCYFATCAAADAVTLKLIGNGVNDTDQLQAALDTCAGAVTTCRIELGEGTFRTGLLLVSDFRGQIVGAGRGKTFIKPMADCYLRPTLFLFEQPPTRDNPYPALLHFTDGGKITITDVTFSFSSEMRVARWMVTNQPCLCWTNPRWQTLLAAILVDGGADQRADLVLARVDIWAAIRTAQPHFSPNTNVLAAVAFGGKRAFRPDQRADSFNTPPELWPEPLGGGSFLAREVRVSRSGMGFALHDANHLDVRIVGNSFVDTQRAAVSFVDVGASQVCVASNHVVAPGNHIESRRGLRRFWPGFPAPSTERSSFSVSQNDLRMRDGSAGTEIFIQDDFGGILVPDPRGRSNDFWVVRNNDFRFEGNLGVAIIALGDLGNILIESNRTHHSGGIGVHGFRIGNSTGTLLVKNSFRDWPAGRPNIELSLTRDLVIREPWATFGPLVFP